MELSSYDMLSYEQFLSWMLIAGPHVLEHDDHSPHSPLPPGRACKIQSYMQQKIRRYDFSLCHAATIIVKIH